MRKLRELHRELEEYERLQVARALTQGASFASVGRDLGLSRQAVHRRFRDLARASDDALPLVPTPEVRLAMRYAREEAAAVGAPKLEGQHVLLGVLRAATLPPLADAGVTLERARAHVDATTPRSRRFGTRPETGAMLAEPAREALRRGSRRIQAEHLLLGVLRTDSGAARTLRALGADPRGVEAALDALAEPSLR